MKIKKVCGYREKNGQSLFLVVWADKKTTWEYASNIHCAALVQRFYAKLVENLSDAEERQKEAEAKLEEKDIISRLRVLKRSKTEPSAPQIVRSVCEGGSRESVRAQEKSTAAERPAIDAKEEFRNKVFVQGLHFRRPSSAGMQRYFDTDGRAGTPGTVCAVDRHALFTYHFIPRHGNAIHASEREGPGAQQSGTRQISISLKGVVWAKCGVRTLLQSFACNPQGFVCERLEACSAFYSMFFTLRQRSKRCFMNVHELDVVSLGDGLGRLYLFLSERKYVMVDSKAPEYTDFIVFNARQLLGCEISSKLVLVQIRKLDFMNESMAYNRRLEHHGSQHLMRKGTAAYYLFAEGFSIFNLYSLGLKSIFSFGMYTDSRNRLSRELRKNLAWCGGAETSLKEDSMDYVFVDRQYVQYLHVMPGIGTKVEGPCVFYSYGFDESMLGCSVDTRKILCNGGVFTFTKKILEAPDFPGLVDIFKLAKKDRGKWMLRIPSLLLDGFKARLSEVKNTLNYAGMLEMYNQLKNSVEDIRCRSIGSYMCMLRQKYFAHKRFFYIVNDSCCGEDIKTPEERPFVWWRVYLLPSCRHIRELFRVLCAPENKMKDKIAECCRRAGKTAPAVYGCVLSGYSVLDHVLFFSVLAHLCIAYGSQQWLSFLLFFAAFYDCRQSLLMYERFYISVSLAHVESCMENSKVFYVTHALLLERKEHTLDSVLCLIQTQLLFECNIANEIARLALEIRYNFPDFAHILLQVLVCAIVQAAMLKCQHVNTKRKVFHFTMFFIFLQRSALEIQLGHVAMLLFVLLQDNRRLARLYQPFLSHRDCGGRVYSHILLLGSVLYSAISLETDREYHLVLATVCFLDSFASIAGKCAGSNKKSLTGLLGGFFAGNAVYFLIYRSFAEWRYFAAASLVEYFSACNDNIVLPLFSTIFLKRVCGALA
ncbi:UNVERIFIED_CONTAM: hypothetical protein PYX00_011368 [Menopon gallinae]|uniref:Uncharacterized protein n=1 Tax=Menopon gallinae TaxID=328185 RepID=A0AAW2H7C0_9NEOP